MPGYVLRGPSDTGRWTRIIIVGPRLISEFSGPWHMAAYVISMATVFTILAKLYKCAKFTLTGRDVGKIFGGGPQSKRGIGFHSAESPSHTPAEFLEDLSFTLTIRIPDCSMPVKLRPGSAVFGSNIFELSRKFGT